MNHPGVSGLIVLAILAGGCGREQPAPVPIRIEEFSGTNAFRHVEQLVNFGPRPAGSAALAKSAAYILTRLRAAGLEAEEQVFQALTPNGPVQFRNVVARTRRQTGQLRSVIILGSHYDTKLMPQVKMVGANDAGSSTGALLELARVAADQPDLWFVFFDGEEAMREFSYEDGLWGSKFFVEDLKGADRLGEIRAMVLLDMIGDADLSVTIHRTGSSELAQELFAAARDLGHRDLFGVRTKELLDDHVPFFRAGIPALAIIDFEFGSAPGLNEYWHSAEDTLDKISPRSLEIVGRTTLRLINRLRTPAPAR